MEVYSLFFVFVFFYFHKVTVSSSVLNRSLIPEEVILSQRGGPVIPALGQETSLRQLLFLSQNPAFHPQWAIKDYVYPLKAGLITPQIGKKPAEAVERREDVARSNSAGLTS